MLLFSRCKDWRNRKVPIEFGISPVSLLLPRFTATKFCHCL
jgi:hypothetical protein